MTSSSEQPHYHYPRHRALYDTHSPRMHGGEIQSVMECLDELLYFEDDTAFRPHAAQTDGTIFVNYYSQEYTRGDLRGYVWPLETVRLSVEHTIYLGRSALKQSYKIRSDSQIHRPEIRITRVSSMFYLEQVAGEGVVYFGTMIRPDVLPNADVHEEQMTVYDCEQLYGQVVDAISLAVADARDRRLRV